jgi:P4 family phage/plasmid primase-like protien
MEQLGKFLNEHKLEGHERAITHINFTGGKYHIPYEKNDEFLQLYYNCLAEGKRKLHLAECFAPGKKFKFVVDIEIKDDLRAVDINGDSMSNDKVQNVVIPELIESLNSILFSRFPELYNMDTESNEINGSNRSTSTNSKIKTNNLQMIYSSRAPYLVHLNFPQIVVGIKSAKDIINELREIMITKFKDINWNKALDTGIYSAGRSLRMIGSHSHQSKIILEGEYKYYRPYYNASYHSLTLETLHNTSFRTNIDDDEVSTIMSQQMITGEESMETGDVIIEAYIDEIKKKFPDNNLDISSIKKIYFDGSNEPCFVVNLKDRFCPFVKRTHKRASEYLYVLITSHGSSLKCRDEDCCKFKFPEKLISINNTIKKKWYKDPAEEEYANKIESEIIPDHAQLDDDITDLIEKCLSGTHYDIAMLVYHMYKYKFRVDTFGTRCTWYEFKNHRFYPDSNHLGILISGDLVWYFARYKKDMCAGKSEILDEIIKRLKNVPFKNAIISQSSEIFYHNHPSFVKEMDTKKNLICFNNGVYDLDKNEFRDGHIEDCITLSTKNNYIPYDGNSQTVKDIYNFFSKIFTDKAMMEYMLKKIAICLSGHIVEEFNIWTGNGSNGKSRISELIAISFGDYWTEMPVSLLTKPRTSSSAPSPEVMDLKGRRVVTVQEPETKDHLNMGIIKQYTGGDTISARQLHQKQEKITLQIKIFFSCNVIPRVECSDGGTWRRLKICEFKSKFVDNPTKEHEFIKDPELMKKIPTWGDAFLSILINYYNKIQKEGNPEPSCVKEYTQEFRRDSDFFAQFIEDCLIEDKDTVTEFKDINERFEGWCTLNNIKQKLYTKTEIKKLLGDVFGREKVYKIDKDEYKKGFQIKIKTSDNIILDSDDEST